MTMRVRADLGVSLAILLLLWLGSWSGLLREPADDASGSPVHSAGLDGALIVVDPGHGGGDPGAPGADGTPEADNTMSISLKLSHLLEQAGARVALTHGQNGDTMGEGGSDTSLAGRVALAERLGADAFVSVHNDWNQDARAGGTTTYYERSESVQLAKLIQRAVVDALGSKDRGVRYGNFQVLRDTTMPAVLVEVGFVSNPAEAERLSDPAYRQEAASGIYRGLLDYFA